MKAIPLIPKDQIRPDADITALVDSEGYVLNLVYAPDYIASDLAQNVIGRHLSALFKPLPNEFLTSLERLFHGDAHWSTFMLPTAKKSGVIDRRFVVAFMPWAEIDGKQVALTRMKLLSECSLYEG